MKNIVAGFAVLASFSQYLCIFCCVVPAVAGLAGLLTLVGFDGESGHFLSRISGIFHPWRIEIMSISFVLLTLSWGLWFYARKAQTSACGCQTKGGKKPFFLIAASAILVFNLLGYQWIHG
ncbi:MAG: hypothetical protein J0L77_07245 [Alphaproteobacteria bacterium]|nr:hypothetical protein [Alphaproteobacteria bacterium]